MHYRHSIFLLAVLFLLANIANAQADYRISDARKVKENYKPFPKDVRSQKLDWTALKTDCLGQIVYGNWFELQLKGTQIKFNVHTGDAFGNLSNPGIYMGKVVNSSTQRSIEQIACITHNGSSGVFSLEATGLSPDATYFVLVTSKSEGAFYGISTNTEFVPSAPPAKDLKTANLTEAFKKIVGRIYNKTGEGVEGVEIELLNENKQQVAKTRTGSDGVFKFEQLPRDEVFITRIAQDDTELRVDMFLIDHDGNIANRSTRIDNQLYAFGAREDAFPQLNLLTHTNWENIQIANGEVAVIGKVVDKESYLFGQPGVGVSLYNDQASIISTSSTDDEGNFKFTGLTEAAYLVKVSSKPSHYVEMVMVDDLLVPYVYANSNMINAEGFFVFEALPKEAVRLQRLEERDSRPALLPDFSHMDDRQPIVLRNILFASGSADLLEGSELELNALADALKSRPELRIEVSGHTDNLGNQATNKLLSEARAKSVVNYLISQGIAEDRLNFVGFGDTRPVVSNDTEEGRRRNRRVEFVVRD
jgi:outer membrane protein OmpA-like peptidoglycan-associated protein